MNIEEIRNYCLSLPLATEDVPFGKQGYDDVAFRVAGKIFAFLLTDDSRMVDLKCDPERALELRERYPGVVEPAFHWNKRYWNQIHYDSPLLNRETIEDMIAHSYNQVIAKLSRKTRTDLHLSPIQ